MLYIYLIYFKLFKLYYIVILYYISCTYIILLYIYTYMSIINFSLKYDYY